MKTISPQQLHEKMQSGEQIHLVDVRTPVEYRATHVESARNVPLDRLDPEAVIREANGSEQPLYFICQSGSRAEKACEKLKQAGFHNVINVEGGTNACAQADLPLVHGKKAISLERQVRIAAGSLVLIGVAAAYFHPAFLAISAFVGAGLVFAGITDTCGMGMMLVRMPWNQCDDSGETCAAS